MYSPLDCRSGSNFPLSQCVTYALPYMGTLYLLAAMPIVQGLYAKDYGLALTTIAAVVLVARLFDAVTDPSIGYLSDRLHARSGTRKPLIAAGGLLIIFASFFLFRPPDNVTSSYLLLWYLIFYLAWTLFEIPHLAWAGELTTSTQDRIKIYAIRNLVGYIGAVVFLGLPLLPIFDTNAFTPGTMKYAVLIVALVMPVLLYRCIKRVPNGNRNLADQVNCGDEHIDKAEWRLLLQSILGSKPLLLFLAAYSLSNLGAGMSIGLFFIFADTYLGIGDNLSVIYLLSTFAGLIAIGGWYKLSQYVDKRLAWGMGTVMLFVFVVGKGFVPVGNAAFAPVLILEVIGYTGGSAIAVFVPSMMADIVDYGTWKFGIERTATHFSLYTFVTKVNGALGGALGLAIAGWYGFDASASTHSEDSVFGLWLGISWLPALLVLASLPLIALSPMTNRRSAIIRRRLDARRRRSEGRSKAVLKSDMAVGT